MGITYSQGIDVDAALKTFLDTFGPYLFKFRFSYFDISTEFELKTHLISN